MAGRVNTKFVLVLATALVLLVVAVAAFQIIFVRKSAAEYEAMGDQYLIDAQNRLVQVAGEKDRQEKTEQQSLDYQLAAEHYGLAFSKDPKNASLLLKYIDAARQMTVEDARHGSELAREIFGNYRYATDLRPNDQELHEAFFQMVWSWARELNDTGLYATINDIATTRLNANPDNLAAVKWRGIIQAREISPDKPEDTLEKVEADLQRALKAFPDDPEVLHHLALLRLYQAEQLNKQEPDADQVKALREEAVALSRQAFEAHGEKGGVAIDHLDILLDPDVAQVDEARPVLDRLEASLLGNPQPPYLVRRVAELLPRLFITDDPDAPTATIAQRLQRTENLLAVATDKRPDVLAYGNMLANLLRNLGRYDEAYELYKANRDAPSTGTAEETMRDQAIREQAAYESADLELIKAERTEDAAQRKVLIDQAEQTTDALEKSTGNAAMIQLLRGKTALLRGQDTKAMILIDKASGLLNDQHIEALLLSARARQKAGQWGAASQRLESALALIQAGRQNIQINARLQLIDLLIRGRDLERAREQLLIVNGQAPGSIMVQRLLAEWHLANKEPEEALAILSELPADTPGISSAMARAYRAAGKEDLAKEQWVERFERDPSDLRALRSVLSITDDRDDRLALIEQAAQAGASSGQLEVLRLQNSDLTGMSVQDVADQMSVEGESPLDAALRKAQLFITTNQIQDAKTQLDIARRLGADDERVLLTDLELAIKQEDFERARGLVNEAARRNLDLAQGHLLSARLAAAQGDTKQAITSYDLGLKQRPVYDEGWRQYGDLLLGALRFDAAAAAYQTAAEQRPDNLRARLGLALTQDRLGKHYEALVALRDAQRFAPRNAEVFNRYAEYEARHGDPQVALQRRRDRMRDASDDRENIRQLALLEARLGNTGQALRTLNRADVDGKPNLALSTTRAQILAQSGDAAGGLATMRAFLKARGDEASLGEHLAVARFTLMHSGWDQALPAYQPAIEREDPERRLATQELANLLFEARQNDAAASLYRNLYEELPDGPSKQTAGLRLVESLMRQDKNDEASSLLKTLPSNSTHDTLGSMLAQSRGDNQQAMQLVNRAIEADGGNAAALVQRSALQAGDTSTWNAAMQDIDRALAIQPDMVAALTLKADFMLRTGRGQDAIAALEALLSVAPHHEAAARSLTGLYLESQQPAKAEPLIRLALNRYPGRPDWLRLDADLALRQGDKVRAIRDLELAMKAAPQPAVLLLLCTLYLDQENPAAAERALTDQAELLNNSALLQSMRGQALATMGRTDEARNVFAHAISTGQNLSEIGAGVQAASRAFDVEQAVALADSVKAPSTPQWRDIAITAVYVQNQRYEDAIKRARAIRAASPTLPADLDATLARLEAQAMHEVGDIDQAKAAYEKLLAMAPDHLETLNNYAYFLANRADNPTEALKWAEKAAKINPGHWQILDTLGWVRFNLGQLKEARATLEKSVQIQEGPANVYHLGRVYAALELTGFARQRLEQAQRLAEESGDTVILEKATKALQTQDSQD